MNALSRDDLYSLEEYAKVRKNFRAKVMAHKKLRQIPIGPNATLYFEDRLTMQYQIQEMLRIERIFEPEGIQEELEAYNPLIPDGHNWKATFMVEFPDTEERREALTRLIGIEDRVWVQVEGFEKSWSIADEDLEREDETKTSSVHFLRFELNAGMISALRDGTRFHLGIDHPAYQYSVEDVNAQVRESLLNDLH